MAKQRIALLFGGVSSDSHKYLPSVRSVAEALSEKQYEVVLLGITPKGKWLFCPGELSLLQQEDWTKHPDCCLLYTSRRHRRHQPRCIAERSHQRGATCQGEL